MPNVLVLRMAIHRLGQRDGKYSFRALTGYRNLHFPFLSFTTGTDTAWVKSQLAPSPCVMRPLPDAVREAPSKNPEHGSLEDWPRSLRGCQTVNLFGISGLL